MPPNQKMTEPIPDSPEPSSPLHVLATVGRDAVTALPAGATVTVSRTWTIHARTVTESVTLTTPLTAA